MRLPSTPATSVIPLALPTTVFPTMTLSFAPAAIRPIPKLLPWVASPFPISRFSRSRFRVAPVDSHMPPHGNVVLLALRTAILPSITLSSDAATKIPDMQFVEAVTCVTNTRELPRLMLMPIPRNRWTIPGPWITTPRMPWTRIPSWSGVGVPAHPVTGSADPVIENPCNLSEIPEAPNAMHGAGPVTVQVTSPTSWLSSVRVNVLEMVPRISAADDVSANTRRTAPNTLKTGALLVRILAPAFLCSPFETTVVASASKWRILPLRLTERPGAQNTGGTFESQRRIYTRSRYNATASRIPWLLAACRFLRVNLSCRGRSARRNSESRSNPCGPATAKQFALTLAIGRRRI